MKARHFLIILALGALSTNVGFAGDDSHPANTVNFEQGSRGTDAAIDTPIAMHQGRVAPNSKELKEIRDLKERLFRNSKTTIAPAVDPVHLSIQNHQQTAPLGADGARARNAVGAVIGHRAGEPQSGPSGPSGATRQGSSLPAIGAPISGKRGPEAGSTGDTSKQLNGIAPASDANAIPPGNHPAKTTALAIVTTNGPALNGTGINRLAPGSGAVGGPAKVVTGAISGSNFRPKHP